MPKESKVICLGFNHLIFRLILTQNLTFMIRYSL